jgi:hypothetical protein
VDVTRRLDDLSAEHAATRAQAIAAANLANANSILTQPVFMSTSGSTFPNDNAWHRYGLSDGHTCPDDANTLSWFLWASSGTSFSAGQTGVLEVQVGSGQDPSGSDQSPVGQYVAQTSGTATGAAMTSQITWAGYQTGITPGTTLYLSVFALANGASIAGSSGVNLNGILFWGRHA